MYTSQILNERINVMLDLKSKTKKAILLAAKANENILNQMSDKKGMSCFTLAKIADELDCSVDYLLGRTDTPQITINGNNNISQNNISGNATANIGTVDNERSDSDAQELLGMINRLSLVQRAEIILKINDMLK